MAQSLTILVPLSRSRTGLAATLRAQLRDTVGVAVGSLITTGFVEVGQGHYQWFYAAYPDGFEGRVDFVLSTATSVNVATMPVNDADFGITSVTSAAAIAAAVWDEPTSGHVSAGSFGALVASIFATVTRAWHAAMNRK